MSRNQFKRFVKAIANESIKEPIVFIEQKGVNYVVDGYHRLRAANSLGIENVPVKKVSLPYGQYKTPNDLIYQH